MIVCIHVRECLCGEYRKNCINNPCFRNKSVLSLLLHDPIKNTCEDTQINKMCLKLANVIECYVHKIEMMQIDFEVMLLYKLYCKFALKSSRYLYYPSFPQPDVGDQLGTAQNSFSEMWVKTYTKVLTLSTVLELE